MKPLPLSLLVVLAPAAAQASCPVFDVAADQAATAVRGFQFAVADEALAEALTAVGCAEVDDPQRLARLMRIHGARRFFDEDVAGAERYLAAARALDAETFEAETWGDEALALWRSADAGRWGEGTLAVIVPGGAPIVVDGRPGQNPAKVAAIPHVVRLGAFAARVADVQPEATTVVDLSGVDLTPPTPPVVAPVAAPDPVVEAPPSDEPPPIAEPKVAADDLAAPPSPDHVPGTVGVALPIVHDHGRWYTDGRGALISNSMLIEVVGDSADRRFVIAQDELRGWRNASTASLAIGAPAIALVAPVTAVYISKLKKYEAEWDDPASPCHTSLDDCRPKPGGIWVSSTATFGVGMTVAGLAFRAPMRKLRQEAAQAANVALAEVAADDSRATSEGE